VLTHKEIKEIESQFGSPFYILDEAAFVKNYDDIVNAFTGRYEKFILAYSYKTNYIPYLCGIIKTRGGYAEVVSRIEYDLALKIGQDPKRLFSTGRLKITKMSKSPLITAASSTSIPITRLITY